MIRPGTAAGASSGKALARPSLRAVVVATACALLAACAQSGPGALDLAAPSIDADRDAAAKQSPTALAKATDAAGKAYMKEPRDVEKALAYARSLKAMGEKRQALAVLQQAANFNAGHRGLNSEYGRLALEFDQVSLAQRLLEAADDPANPDWRVISARGTVLAKLGQYREAIPLYERALALAPDQPSILNNLALAHTMEGHADRGEPLLKRAAASGSADQRVNQNLALVLGLQGKYDEARLAAARDLPAENAAANVDYVRRIVMLEPRAMSPSGQVQPGPAPKVAAAPSARPELRGSAPADDAGAGWAPKVATAPGTP